MSSAAAAAGAEAVVAAGLAAVVGALAVIGAAVGAAAATCVGLAAGAAVGAGAAVLHALTARAPTRNTVQINNLRDVLCTVRTPVQARLHLHPAAAAPTFGMNHVEDEGRPTEVHRTQAITGERIEEL